MILGIHGKKGSGKSFLASTIKEGLHQEDVYVTGFAEDLKRICSETLCLSEESIYGNDHQKNTLSHYKWEMIPTNLRGDKTGFMTSREVMQFLGTEVFRNMFHENVWIDNTLKRIKKRGAALSIIADLRFENEVNAIKLHGGEVWSIVGVRRADERFQNDKHDSEKELNMDMFDYIINNGSGETASSLFEQATKSRLFTLGYSQE